jgi:DNA-binding MltR family transcriptional regulator
VPVYDDFEEIANEARRKRESGQLSDAEFSEIVERALRRAGFQNVELAREVLQLRQTLSRETDRGVALTAGAYLDEMLTALLTAFFVNHAKIAAEFFAPAGPLGSFSAKIDMSYALGLLSAKARFALHIIRRIRNEFAHVSAGLTFGDEAVASRCGALCADAGLKPRQGFTRAALRLVGTIYAAFQQTEHREPAAEVEPSADANRSVQRLNWAIDDETDSHYFNRALYGDDDDAE